MMVLKAGTKAPLFSLKDKDGNIFSLKDFGTKYTIVYFYPKDNTPGCTIQAKKFTEHLGDFGKLKTMVVGISGGDEKTKTEFVHACDLKVVLLSDQDLTVSKAYGVYGEHTRNGKTSVGIARHTFLLDHNLKVLKVFEFVDPNTHIQDLLKHLNSLP